MNGFEATLGAGGGAEGPNVSCEWDRRGRKLEIE